MLFQWLQRLADEFSVLNVFQYITFRTFVAFLTSFFVCWFSGPYFIKQLVRRQLKQVIREDGPKAHLKKVGTPTMGGWLVLFSILMTSLLWADWSNPLVLALLCITFSFGLIGYWDDYLKVAHKSSQGFSMQMRLLLEFTISATVIFCLVHWFDFSTQVSVPIFKKINFDLGWFYLLFSCCVIVGCANAVNLTDGLDGLAIAPIIIATGTYLILSYVAGHVRIAEYLQIQYVPGSGELAPLAAMVVAAGLGFLWYNFYPAQVIMGDVGSLGMGGFLGTIAVLTKNELLLMVVGGIFTVEALSVIAQVLSFKLTGKRVFKMAPLHHHFELKGVDETKIVVRFWIVSILLAVLSLSTLKLR